MSSSTRVHHHLRNPSSAHPSSRALSLAPPHKSDIHRVRGISALPITARLPLTVTTLETFLLHAVLGMVSSAPLAQVCSGENQQSISSGATDSAHSLSYIRTSAITLPRLQCPHCTAYAPALAPIPMFSLCEHACPPAGPGYIFMSYANAAA